ncbi:helix-turn-helix transcriptional regulator [Xanthobacter autotrophicus]|uniref:helix-turn-helix domain-containing protein n=1 Tax=Xanthobacter autotrophicus TaxID=280 RepID=UPI00372A04AA
MRNPPKPEDIAIGARIRRRRMLIGMSQEKLGERLGITFQQIQKYEKGTNRISGSRILQVANVLDVPPQWLLVGDEGAEGGELPGGDHYCREAWRMVAALPSPQAKAAALHALKAITTAFEAPALQPEPA